MSTTESESIPIEDRYDNFDLERFVSSRNSTSSGESVVASSSNSTPPGSSRPRNPPRRPPPPPPLFDDIASWVGVPISPRKRTKYGWSPSPKPLTSPSLRSGGGISGLSLTAYPTKRKDYATYSRRRPRSQDSGGLPASPSLHHMAPSTSHLTSHRSGSYGTGDYGLQQEYYATKYGLTAQDGSSVPPGPHTPRLGAAVPGKPLLKRGDAVHSSPRDSPEPSAAPSDRAARFQIGANEEVKTTDERDDEDEITTRQCSSPGKSSEPIR